MRAMGAIWLGVGLASIHLKQLYLRLATFGVVGLIGTAAHYLTLVWLVEAVDIDPVTATSAGFLVGALVNYYLNHRYTFQSQKGHFDAGPKFFLIALITGLLNSLLVHIGVGILELHYLIVQIGATGIVFLVNFAINALWTFRETNGG